MMKKKKKRRKINIQYLIIANYCKAIKRNEINQTRNEINNHHRH